MQTYRYRDRISLDALELVDTPPPPSPAQLAPTAIVVRVAAASLNYRDIAIATAGYGTAAGFPIPLVPLSDAAGHVVATGARVTRFSVGDRVIPTYVPDWLAGAPAPHLVQRRLGGPTDGVLRELLVVDEQSAVRAPSHLTLAEASTLPVAGATVWQALAMDARLPAGSTVAVRGTGGVAMFVVLVARALGLRPIVVVRAPTHVAQLRALGAEVIAGTRTAAAALTVARAADCLHTNAATTAPSIAATELRHMATASRASDALADDDDLAWDRSLLDVTNGTGVDLFVDVVGGADTQRAVSATRLGGTVALVGFAGSTTATIDIPRALRQMVTLRAASAGSRAALEGLVAALESHDLRPLVDRTFPFAHARAAFYYQATGKPFGKVVIRF